MGSPDLGLPSDYRSVKGRIDTALDTLRQQLMEMQQQDVVLLRQLMQIHTTIQTLTGRRDPYRRSMSSSAISTPHAPPAPLPVRNHRPLVRLQSAPMRQESENDTDDVTEDEEDYEEDLLTQSFSSFSTDPLEWSFSRLRCSSTTDNLPPIPRSLRRKLCAPITETPEPETSLSPPSSPSSPPPPLPLQPPPLEPPPSSPGLSEALDYPDSFMAEIVPRESWTHSLPQRAKIGKYEPSYETMLKRSSQLWRDVQRERQEKGTVDQKKMTTLKLFL